MKRIVEFSHDLGDTVQTPIGMMGKVDSLSVDNNGLMYRVVYWNDGQRYSTWMYEWEFSIRAG